MAEPLDIKPEDFDMHERTLRGFISSVENAKPGDDMSAAFGAATDKTLGAAGSVWDGLMFVLNAGLRAGWASEQLTYEKMHDAKMQGADVYKMAARWKEIWDDEDVKNLRLHNTYIGEDIGRLIYALGKWASETKYKAGIYGMPDYETQKLSKITEYAMEPAATDFARKYGAVVVDIPFQIAAESAFGTLKLFSKLRHAQESAFLVDAVKHLPSAPSLREIKNWAVSWHDGGMLSDKILKNIRDTPRELLPHFMSQLGFRKHGFLSRFESSVRDVRPDLAQMLGMPWFRPRGYDFTAQQNLLRQEYMAMMRWAREELAEAIEKNKDLVKFIAEASTREMVQVIAFLSSPKMLDRANYLIDTGAFTPGPRVGKAIKDFQAIRQHTAQFYNKHWRESWFKAINGERIEREIRKYVMAARKAGKAVDPALLSSRMEDFVIVPEKTVTIGTPIDFADKAFTRAIESVVGSFAKATRKAAEESIEKMTGRKDFRPADARRIRLEAERQIKTYEKRVGNAARSSELFWRSPDEKIVDAVYKTARERAVDFITKKRAVLQGGLDKAMAAGKSPKVIAALQQKIEILQRAEKSMTATGIRKMRDGSEVSSALRQAVEDGVSIAKSIFKNHVPVEKKTIASTIIDKSGQAVDLPKSIVQKIIRLAKDEATLIPSYYRRAWMEAANDVPGAMKPIVARVSQELVKGKSQKTAAVYMKKVLSSKPEDVKYSFQKMVDGLIALESKEIRSGGRALYMKRIEQYADEVRKAPDSDFTGPVSRKELLRRIDDTEKYLAEVFDSGNEKYVAPTLTALAQSARLVDSANKTWKTWILMSPTMLPGYVAYNGTENFMKGTLFTAGKQYMNELPTHDILGKRIDGLISDYPGLPPNAGFDAMLKIKKSDTSVGKAWRWWSDVVDKTNAYPEHVGKGIGTRYDIQRFTAEGIDAGLSPEDAVRVAREKTDVNQDGIQFAIRPLSVAMSWLERASPFAHYGVSNFMASAKLMADQPVLAPMYYRFLDELGDGEVGVGGNIHIPKTGVSVPLSAVIPFGNLSSVMRKTPGPQSVETAMGDAIGAGAAIAGAVALGGTHYTTTIAKAPLTIAQLPVALLKKVTGDTELDDMTVEAYSAQRKDYADAVDRVDRLLSPLNRFTQAFFNGRKVTDVLDPNEGRREAIIIARGKLLDGGAMDDKEAIATAFDRRENSAWLSMGAAKLLREDARPGERRVRQMIEEYRALGTPADREAYLRLTPRALDSQGVPGAEGSVIYDLVQRPNRVPRHQPDSKYLSSVQDVLDNPEKAIENFKRGTEEQKFKAFREFGDDLINLFTFATPAGAGELPPKQRSAQAKADDSGIQADFKKFQAQKAVAEAPASAPLRPLSEAKGGFIPQLRPTGIGEEMDFLPNGGDDPVLRSVIAKMSGERNSVLKQWMAAFKRVSTDENATEADFEKVRAGFRPIGPSGSGQWEKLNPRIMAEFNRPDERGVPVIAVALARAKESGVLPTAMDGKVLEDGRTVLPGKDAFPDLTNFVNYIEGRILPQSFQIRRDERLKQQRIAERGAYAPFAERMLELGKNPGIYDLRAEWEQMKATSQSGAVGAPPADFIKRMMENGDRNEWDNLARFAVGLKAEAGEKLVNEMRDNDGKWSSHRIKSLDAGGWGDEMVAYAAATEDKYLIQELQDAGIEYNPKAIVQDALYPFITLDAGVDIEPRHVIASAGRLSAGGQRFTSDGGLALEGGAEPALPQPGVGQGGLEPRGPDADRGFGPLQAVAAISSISDIIVRRDAALAYRPGNAQFGPYSFSGPRDFAETTLREVRQKNHESRQRYADAEAKYRTVKGVPTVSSQVMAEMDAAMREGSPIKPYQTNFFQEARDNMQGLPFTSLASTARTIAGLGYNLGVMDYDAVKTLDRGITQVQTQEQLQGLVTAAFSFSSSAIAGMNYAQRINFIRANAAKDIAEGASLSAVDAAGIAKDPGYGAVLTNRGLAAQKYANYAGYAALAGQAASFGAGVAQAQGEEELAQGLGTAGGALQGASYGYSVGGPWGAAIGAGIGAIVGHFTSTMGKEDNRRGDRDAYNAAFAANQARQAAEAEGRAVQSRSRTLAYQQGESLRRNPQTAQNMIQRFVRRPQFTSSQGLVAATERSAGRQFVPRY